MGSHYDYIAIDLKSFYASVECRERGLDPLTTNLVVADAERTEKTICLAVSPSLKSYGVGGRARLFEVVQKVREVNAARLRRLRHEGSGGGAWCPRDPGVPECLGRSAVGDAVRCRSLMRGEGCDPVSLSSAVGPLPDDVTGKELDAYRPFEGALFQGASFDDRIVGACPWVELDYLVARPRMALYLEYSTRIYQVYLRHFAPEDIHVYSIDEVFIDAGGYRRSSGCETTALASKVVRDIFEATGITATAGLGTNLYLAKVAMDILAKHEKPDENGVRLARLDERDYRRRLWEHEPLTDFWRIGAGYARKLAAHGMTSMGDVARCSLGGAEDQWNQELLFRLFGKSAELLIDHAWGFEPVTMKEIKAYQPRVKSTVAGQVLQRPYGFEDARLVAWEMADQLALDLTAAGMETDKVVLTVGYDRESLAQAEGQPGLVAEDAWGRKVPKSAHGTLGLQDSTAASTALTRAVLELFDRLVDRRFLVRKISITAENLVDCRQAAHRRAHGQMSLFDTLDEGEREGEALRAREEQVQETMLDIRAKFGKNAIVKAPSLKEAATARQRNCQIGGHRA